jgi:uncharacterized Ntn-hydrolase superfamily protein
LPARAISSWYFVAPALTVLFELSTQRSWRFAIMKQGYLGLTVLSLLLTGLALAGQGNPVTRAPAPQAVAEQEPWTSTFSIAAYDPEKKEWGVAVASKYLAVGSLVPWAKAGVGAVATQAATNTSYGSRGLELMAQGKSAKETIKQLTEEDAGRDSRQLGMVDAKGEAANFTGPECISWAGGKSGKHYTCQGNLLAGEAVVTDMAKAFEESKGPLAWRLMVALEAAEKAGGDKRGKQSAAILVVREHGGPFWGAGFSDRYLDFRVDDHKEPVQELARILALRVRRP